MLKSKKTEGGYLVNHLGYDLVISLEDEYWQVVKSTCDFEFSKFKKKKELLAHIEQYSEEEPPVFFTEGITWAAPDAEYLLGLELAGKPLTDLQRRCLDAKALITPEGEVDEAYCKNQIKIWEDEFERHQK